MTTSQTIGLWLGPVVFFALLFCPHPAWMAAEAWKTIALAAFMLIWWVTEAVPIPVTALLPLVVLPAAGVSTLKEASTPYANPIVFLFMGGFMIALAMEKWELHRRIALTIVRWTGTHADGILFGFMLATASLSMWISNTATTIMMLPIALSVIQLLRSGEAESREAGFRNFSLTMMLGIAWSANIGGLGTLIGTPPTVVFAGFMEKTYGREVSFAQWLAVGLPFALIMLGVTWFFLVKIMYPNHLGKPTGARRLIQSEIEKLGPLSTGERRTLFLFCGTALAWIFRSPLNRLFPGLHFSDTGIAMLATVLLFVVPVNYRAGQFVLDWKATEKLPWGIILLFGGGLSLAGALEKTGIIDLIGGQFRDAGQLGFWVIMGLTVVSLFLTEIIGNLALVTVFLPVVGGIATGAGIDPMLAAIPVTVAASCAFTLPMSTPPNAIVFASGYVRVSEMAKAGIVLNVVAILLIGLLVRFVLPVLF
ncbi:MAG: DASS family sodium-coupled anion symporter [Bacteroidetes bacterium]|nr:MAG: DASS family sodium-coupled anion symporter [Bacteroidota bacterium]